MFQRAVRLSISSPKAGKRRVPLGEGDSGMSIELGIGVSTHADIATAGRLAAEQVLSHLAGRTPDLTLVFASIRFADPVLLKSIRTVTSNAPLIGCTDS